MQQACGPGHVLGSDLLQHGTLAPEAEVPRVSTDSEET